MVKAGDTMVKSGDEFAPFPHKKDPKADQKPAGIGKSTHPPDRTTSEHGDRTKAPCLVCELLPPTSVCCAAVRQIARMQPTSNGGFEGMPPLRGMPSDDVKVLHTNRLGGAAAGQALGGPPAPVALRSRESIFAPDPSNFYDGRPFGQPPPACNDPYLAQHPCMGQPQPIASVAQPRAATPQQNISCGGGGGGGGGGAQSCQMRSCPQQHSHHMPAAAAARPPFAR